MCVDCRSHCRHHAETPEAKLAFHIHRSTAIATPWDESSANWTPTSILHTMPGRLTSVKEENNLINFEILFNFRFFYDIFFIVPKLRLQILKNTSSLKWNAYEIIYCNQKCWIDGLWKRHNYQNRNKEKNYNREILNITVIIWFSVLFWRLPKIKVDQVKPLISHHILKTVQSIRMFWWLNESLPQIDAAINDKKTH